MSESIQASAPSPEAESRPVAAWQRAHWQAGGGDAEVVYAAFSELPLPRGLAVRPGRHGLPDPQLPPEVELLAFSRAEHAAWIDGWWNGALGELAKAALGWAEPPRDRLQHAFVVRARAADPGDLRYLQHARGLLRALAWAGAFCAVDAASHRWLRGEQLRAEPVDGGFDVRDHVQLLVPTEPLPPFGHVAHTRGLKTFGRPDLLMTRLQGAQPELVTGVLEPLADQLARGAQLAPGDRIQLGRHELMALRYVPDVSAPQLELNNDGLLLRPHDADAESAHRKLEALLGQPGEA